MSSWRCTSRTSTPAGGAGAVHERSHTFGGPLAGRRRRAGGLLLALAGLIGGCAGAGGQAGDVWVQDRTEAPPRPGPYLIGPGDLLGVRVQGQENMSGKARVREDGRISLPFLSELQAAGLSPLDLSRAIQGRLQEYVRKPAVLVSVEEARPLEVSVVGAVRKAGSYQLGRHPGVLQALAAAGGLGEFADPERIFVLRSGARIRFSYPALTAAEPKALAFRLRPGDAVVVE